MALDGVVANNAKHALGEFDVEVTLKDCEDKTKETNCKVVGQARGTATPAVPSGQTRSFNTSDLRFDNLPREVQVRVRDAALQRRASVQLACYRD